VNHTPGPWTTEPCSNGGLILRRGGGLEEHRQPFLQVLPEADARLIAAAPEMLATLKRLLTLPVTHLCGTGEKLVLAAIAQAEGRS
jgi:hypothetical protein